jgi:hypothetical protein
MDVNESQAQRPCSRRLQKRRACLVRRKIWWMPSKIACTRTLAQFERAEA